MTRFNVEKSRLDPDESGPYRGLMRVLTWCFVLAFTLQGRAGAAEGGAPGHYSGMAVDEHGRPVAGATVECYVDASPAAFYTAQDFALKERTTTDGKGGFTVPIGDGVTIVAVKKDGLAPGWRTFASALEDSKEPVVLTGLATPARAEVDANGQLISYSAPVPHALEGKVVDEDGRPVAGADVWVTMAMPIPGGGVAAPAVQPGADPLAAVSVAALPGGEFSQRSMIFGKAARDCFSVRTGADGRFRIANFPGNTQASLTAHKSGMALVPPANVGGGMVRVPGFGFAVPNHNVPSSIEAPPPNMSGQHVNLAAASLQHDLMPYISGQLNIEFVLERAGNIEGKVIVQGTVQPMAGVKLIALNAGKGLAGLQMPEAVLSGTDGSFRIADIVPGTFPLAAVFPDDAAADWAARDVNVTVEAGETRKGIQVLAARCRIAGTMRDPAGLPVAGAKVTLNPGGMGVEAGSDARGHYEATWDAFGGGGVQSFALFARNTERQLVARRVIDASSTNFDLNLVPSVTIIAKLQDPRGKPVTNASANFAWHEGDKTGYLGAGISDAEGRIEFADTPVEESYSINLCPNGYGCVNENLKLPARHDSRIEFPIVLRPANQQLAGQVLGPDGKPIGGANVFFGGEGQANGHAICDDTGHFSFDYACEGPLWVSAGIQMNGYRDSGKISAQGGDTNVVILFVANGAENGAPVVTTSGRVLDAAGAPVSGAHISVFPDNGVKIQLRSDAGGKYTIVWVNHARSANGGIPFLTVLDPDRHRAASQDLDENTSNLDLRLEPALTLSVKVQDASGRPIRGARANLSCTVGTTTFPTGSATTTDDLGFLEFKDFPQGRHYVVLLEAGDYGSVRLEAKAEETKTNHFEFAPLVLKLGDRKLAGQVLGPDGKPVGGATVYFGGDGQANGHILCDDTGHFSFDHASAGPLWVSSGMRSVNGFGESGKISAQGGDTNVVIAFPANGQEMGARVLATSGRVLDASGAPVSGARISVLPVKNGNPIESTSDPDGKYTILWVKHNMWGSSVIPFISAIDPKRHLAVSKDLDENATNLDLTLKPGLTLSVKVQDAGGEPIPTATASLSIWSGYGQFQLSQAIYQPDERGVIEISGLPQERHYSLGINAKGCRPATLDAPALDTRAGRFDFPTVVLKAADGQPPAHEP